MKCKHEPKTEWCNTKCPHAHEHNEVDACTNGKCPETHKFVDCGAFVEPKPTITIAEAVIMIIENIKVAMKRDRIDPMEGD